VLQGNLNRSKNAHDVLQQTIRELNTDVVIMCEINKNIAKKEGWLIDSEGDVGIKIMMSSQTRRRISIGKGVIGVQMGTDLLIGCYISPNVDLDFFESRLDDLQELVKDCVGDIVIAGDLNAKSAEWGSPVENRRGTLLSEWVARNRMVVHNQGIRPTFMRGNSQSYIDVTISNGKAAKKIQRWQVMEIETLSDHQYISFEIEDKHNQRSQIRDEAVTGWRVKRLNTQSMALAIQKEITQSDTDPKRYTEALTRACNVLLPKKKQGRRREVYWWSESIAELRRKCLKKKRQMVRKNRRQGTSDQEKKQAHELYKQARKKLKLEIGRAKEKAWKEVCQEVEEDPWGLGYKIVTKKIGSQPRPLLSVAEKKEIALKLFPQQKRCTWYRVVEEPPPFTTEELIQAGKKTKSGKAPGPDCIPPEVVKIALQTTTDTALEMYNQLLKRNEFPDRWKEARLVLLQKGTKDSNGSQAYRPICLLDVLGKVYEQLLVHRLNEELSAKHGLSNSQYGFRQGVSTIDAVEKVCKTAKQEMQKTLKTRSLCAMLMIDVKNAFNSASWQMIIEELRRKGISHYLVEVIKSYLSSRYVQIDQTNKIEMTGGVPQGSVLGPVLWNVLYNKILEIPMPKGVEMVAYADDLALVITAKKDEELMELGNEALEKVAEGLKQCRLQMAPEKTTAIMLSGRKKHKTISFVLNTRTIEVGKSGRYLGVTLDSCLSFRRHLEDVTARAIRRMGALSRLMPRTSDPKEGKRRLLCAVAQSTVLYASKVWVGALKIERYRQMMDKVQRRMALSICGAYKTTATETASVLSSLIPLDLLAEERGRMKKKPTENERALERETTINKWQTRWEQQTTSLWTHLIMPDIRPWVTRKYGSVSFRTTQMLSGHGCFVAYLHRIGRSETAGCWFCGGERDDAEHTLLVCERWKSERAKYRKNTENWTTSNLISIMLRSQEDWEAVQNMMEEIMKQKEEEERRRG
jgi:hypothetical protein